LPSATRILINRSFRNPPAVESNGEDRSAIDPQHLAELKFGLANLPSPPYFFCNRPRRNELTGLGVKAEVPCHVSFSFRSPRCLVPPLGSDYSPPRLLSTQWPYRRTRLDLFGVRSLFTVPPPAFFLEWEITSLFSLQSFLPCLSPYLPRDFCGCFDGELDPLSVPFLLISFCTEPC